MTNELPFCYKTNVLLKDFSTFGIGGPATFFTEVKNKEEAQAVIKYCYQKGLRYYVIGKGSNCLFDDRGFDGLVILNRIDYLMQSENIFLVGAGYGFARLGANTARQGFSGLEFAAGIPATVGGAVYMNAGANGSETCHNLKQVLFIKENGDLELFKNSEMNFAYRFSSFQGRKGIIIEASFELTECVQAKHKQREIVDYRLKTQPYGEKSAGCVFRNHECGSAGAIIDRLGLKGMQVGGAKVSEMHANFIVNKEGAKASDILDLIKIIKEKIYNALGIELEEEIRLVPYREI